MTSSNTLSNIIIVSYALTQSIYFTLFAFLKTYKNDEKKIIYIVKKCRLPWLAVHLLQQSNEVRSRSNNPNCLGPKKWQILAFFMFIILYMFWVNIQYFRVSWVTFQSCFHSSLYRVISQIFIQHFITFFSFKFNYFLTLFNTQKFKINIFHSAYIFFWVFAQWSSTPYWERI